MTDSQLPLPSYEFVHDSYASQFKQSCVHALITGGRGVVFVRLAEAEYKSIKARQTGNGIYVFVRKCVS